ncbi:hypothetical protein EC844_12535 [Acinetobacter calcoaceticus]|uniref:Uncharacterized protein n=1 Tax=Acinetobacter calcoaceticus TaxID=471 RepID=A0A4R1XEL1_ACICA|nr:hypothetical protein EC844_12535 [Acinetobacter calcoaceticus]
MVMTLYQAELEIYKRIGQFTGVEKEHLRIENQPLKDGKPFSPPKNKPWCKVYIQYGNSNVSSIGNNPCVRDYGFISVQCFTPKNTGTIEMIKLCDQWRVFLQSFGVSGLEVYLVHAPGRIQDPWPLKQPERKDPNDDFYGKIIRAEFRVN